MESPVRHDEQRHVFVVEAGGREAVLSYELADDGDTVDFLSTYVPNELRNRNVGTRLVCHALDWAKERGLKVVPSCWFVANVADRLPSYHTVLVERS